MLKQLSLLPATKWAVTQPFLSDPVYRCIVYESLNHAKCVAEATRRRTLGFRDVRVVEIPRGK